MNDESVTGRIAEVRERIAIAARAAGRDPSEVRLVLVTKSVGADLARAAIEAGETDFGENRAQELFAKWEALGPIATEARWHFIGRLQRNKVRMVAHGVALWQSVDREEIAREISRHAPGAAVLVQVNVGGEVQKGGCAAGDAPGTVAICRDLGLDVQGLMTVPPAEGDPTLHFRALRRLTDDLGLRECSMGMSGDYERAIAEGASMVRVGSAVFGPRPAAPPARR